ncbi:hypothetical protein PR048_021157 [Dryococelus australis]|uniref:Uncharacterized protein n=1 Tax=Dryococelus australis TaxID=614101 RepID=A0ABQ9GXF1_9NEOP|nr:hypothetical protein PR048_021157 [Dryococelus australis]
MSEQGVVSTRNLLWVSTYALDTVPLPGWPGYMHNCYEERKEFETYILALPFINANTGNPTAIYSALSYAANQRKLADQPLQIVVYCLLESYITSSYVRDTYASYYRAHMMTQAALMMLIIEEFLDLKLQIENNLEDINCHIIVKEK